MKFALSCIFLVFLFLFWSSCKDEKQRALENILHSQKQEMNESKLDLFKKMMIDSSCKVIEFVAPEVDNIYRNAIKDSRINSYLNSIPMLTDSEYKKIYLTISFQEYLNGSAVYGKEIENKFKKALSFYDNKVILRNAIENERLAMNNFNSIAIGDTLSLLLPVHKNNGKPYTFFKGGYPYSNDYSSAEDSLRLLVLLNEKFKGENTPLSPISNPGLYFKVRIIENSDTAVEIRTDSKEGNEFLFCLQLYGRQIKHR